MPLLNAAGPVTSANDGRAVLRPDRATRAYGRPGGSPLGFYQQRWPSFIRTRAGTTSFLAAASACPSARCGSFVESGEVLRPFAKLGREHGVEILLVEAGPL
jgi:hypothetical protein